MPAFCAPRLNLSRTDIAQEKEEEEEGGRAGKAMKSSRPQAVLLLLDFLASRHALAARLRVDDAIVQVQWFT
jgi:hypothetical protein